MKAYSKNTAARRGAPSPGSTARPTITSDSPRPRGPFLWWTLLVSVLLTLFTAPSAHGQASPPGCTGSGLGILLFTDSPDVHIGDTLNYSVTVFNGTGVGPIVCDATGIVAQIVTPDGVSHPVTLRRTSLVNGESDYYPKVVSYVVRAQDVQADATVRATASDTGDIHQNDTLSRGGGNQGVNTEVSLPCVQITAQCVGSVGETGAITFSGTVVNCGNNTLVGVTITNMVNGGQFPVTVIPSIARGQTATFSGSWIPQNPCAPSTATFVVRGVDQFTTLPRTVTNSVSTTCSQVLTPGIQVTKLCPAQPVAPGQLLVFSGTVSNTGNVTLNNIVVVNSQPAANTAVFTRASLAPGEVATFTGSYLAPTNCTVSDTLTATAASVCGVPVSSSASATCPILTTPQISVTAVCPTTTLTPGASVTYTGTVRNTGDISLANVLVVSDRPAANTTVFTVGSLAPGASANFTVAYTVPANGCSLSTVFTATGRDGCSNNSVTNSALTTCGVITAPALAVTLACPPTVAASGANMTYTGTVRNSGNVTLNNVTVTDAQATPSTVLTLATLAPGASANFSATIVAPSDVCSVTSTVNVTGADSCTGAVVSNSASATCPLLTTASVAIQQFCPDVPTAPGKAYLYNGTIRNTGNTTITNLTVVNNLSGATPVLTLESLAPGATANFTGSYLAPTNCTTVSISTVAGRSICGVQVTGAVTSTCPILTTPQILVTAACPTSPLVPGESVTYTGTIRNTGDITLLNVTVVSDRPGPNTAVFSGPSLAPGASANFTATFSVPTDICSLSTLFTGAGRDSCSSVTVQSTAPTTCTVTTAPAVAITLACPPATAASGALITYTGTVRNSGNVTLNNVVVIDTQSSPSTVLTVPTLAPGATANYTASFIAPADACSVTTTVSVTAGDACTAAVVSNTATATCPLLSNPLIAIQQFCPDVPTAPGKPYVFTGTVTNPGNTTITNLVVLNSLSGSTPVLSIASLAPGATANFTGSYLAPTNCSTVSISTVTGRSVCGVAVTSAVTSTCPILTSPSITISMDCPAIDVVPGARLTFNGVVRNNGNITLNNVVVVNDRTGSAPIFTVASLAPGASANFTGSYLTHGDCCVDSSTATATGADTCTGAIVRHTTTKTCTLLTLPKIVVTKVCPIKTLEPGDVLKYSGTVSNAGNITLVGVVVVSDQFGTGFPILGPIVLAAGESVTYDTSYKITPDFCGTDTVTASGYDSCTDVLVRNSVTSTCPVVTTPRIAVTKICPLIPTPRGGQYTFSGAVRNTGNVTLINVYVVDNQPAENTPVIGPITLAPGESVNFTGSYLAPMDCCDTTDTVTARGQDRCSGANVRATATSICPLFSTPRLSITRVCPPNSVAAGGLFEYKGVVRNTGDVNLTNVFVYGSQPNANTPLLGPIELAPGETQEFSGSYTVQAGSDPSFDTVRATGMDVCQSITVTARANCLGPVVTNVVPVPGPSAVVNGMFRLTWSSVPGVTYTVQSKPTLLGSPWTDLPGNVNATGTTAFKDDTLQPNAQRFYRIVVVQD